MPTMMGSLALLLASQAAPPSVDCLWETMGAPVQGEMVALLQTETSTAADFERVRLKMLPAAKACAIGSNGEKITDIGFRDAFTRASMAADRAALTQLGVDPEQVLALWDAIDANERGLLGRYYELSTSDQAAATEWLAAFLSTNGPAREAPARGYAATLLVGRAQLEVIASEFGALPH